VELVNDLNQTDDVPIEFVEFLDGDPVLLMDAAPDRLHVVLGEAAGERELERESRSRGSPWTDLWHSNRGRSGSHSRR